MKRTQQIVIPYDRHTHRKLRQIVICGATLALAGTILTACSGGAHPGAKADAGPSGQSAINTSVSIQKPIGSSSFTARAVMDRNAASRFLGPTHLPNGSDTPSPFISLATPVHLKSKGPFPKAGVTLTFHLNKQRVSAGLTPFIATYNAGTAAWEPALSHFDPTNMTVSTKVPHFSIWGVFAIGKTAIKTLAHDAFNSLFGDIKVTDAPPTCGSATGLTTSISPNDGLMETCVQNGSGDFATLKVKSTLAFPVDVTPPKGSDITSFPKGSIFAQLGGYLSKVVFGGSTTALIAAGSEADMSIAVPPGSTVSVSSYVDFDAYLAGILDSGISVYTAVATKFGKKPDVTLDAITQGKCAAELAQIANPGSLVSVSELNDFTQIAFDCVPAIVKLGKASIVQAVVSVVSGLIENILQSGFLIAMTAIGGVQGSVTTMTISRAATQANTSTSTSTTSTTSEAPRDAYSAAEYQWEQAACLAQAVQGNYWLQAATDLKGVC